MPSTGRLPVLPVRKNIPAMETTMAATWSLEKPSLKRVPMTTHTTVG